MVDRSDTHGGVLIDKVHSLVQERDCLRGELRYMQGRIARQTEEIARLRARVISVAADNTVICRRCLDDAPDHPAFVELKNLRAMLKDQAAEIAQLRALVAAREQVEPLRAVEA